MRTRNYRPHRTSVRLFVLISVLMIAATALAIPFYSVRSETLNGAGKSPASLVNQASTNSSVKTLGWAPTLNMPVVGETIAIYGSDCATPKTQFNFGEVICAVTNGVDVSGSNYYVNWHGPNGIIDGPTITQNPQSFFFTIPSGPTAVGTWKANIGRVSPAESSIIGNPPLFEVLDGPAITIYASDCTTPKTLFNLQDVDKTVCAKATGFQPNQSVLWSNADFELVQNVAVGTGTSTFTLTPSSSLGDWRVILFEPFGGDVYAVSKFTVIDANNPSADLTISKGSASDSIPAGSQAVYTVQLTNLGPSDAIDVEITDSVPANTAFSTFALVSGPANTNCIVPAEGATSGDSVCTIATLARGETATFLAAYNVQSVPTGTVISNTVSVESTTPDPMTDNNTSTATVTIEGVTAETCTLTCPADVVATADTVEGGQPGARVTFSAAGVSGSCGAVSNTPGSGSFFPVGTHSIISQSELNGGTCTFTVTVLDSNPPTIMCPPDVTVTAPEGETHMSVAVGTPTINASGGGTVVAVRSDDTPAVTDENGTIIQPAVVHAVTDPYPIGSTGITWTVTDAGGRKATCTQTITVVAAADRPPVTISCPSNVSVTADSGSCEATISSSTIGSPTTNPSDSNIEVVGVRNDGAALSDPFPAGTTLITWTATDNTNGNVASCTQTVTVTAGSGSDTTPPTLVVPPNVSVTTSSCSATLDDELGTAEASDSGACGGTVGLSRTGVPANFVFPTGTTVITYTATDAAGNTSTGVQLVTVTEAPPVAPTIVCPANITVTLPMNSTAVTTSVNYTTPVGQDNCPGAVTTQTSGLASGAMFPVGTTNNAFTVTDKSGNTASCNFNVTVHYNFDGFFSPIGNTPVLNSVKAGSAIPIKFSLSGDKGLNIFAANNPYSVSLNCSTTDPGVDVTETVNAGGSSLSYDAATDQYIYVWKTDKAWKDTCRQLVLTLNDGTVHVANFKFK